MLEEAAHTTYAGLPLVFPVLATLAAVFSVAYSARFAFGTFLGPQRHDYPHHPHDPPAGMWLPVAVLVVPVIAIGLFPEQVAGALVRLVAGAVVGGPLPDYHFALWHGLTPALAMSLVAFAGGAVLILAYRRAGAAHAGLPHPDARAMFEATTLALLAASRKASEGLQNGSLPRYMAAILATLIAAGTYGYWTASQLPVAGRRCRSALPPSPSLRAVSWPAARCSCSTRSRLAALLADRRRRRGSGARLPAVLRPGLGADADLGGRRHHHPAAAGPERSCPRPRRAPRAPQSGCATAPLPALPVSAWLSSPMVS